MPTLDQSCTPGVVKLGPLIGDQELESHVTTLKALAHPVRLRMVELIQQGGGDICVCEFERHFELKQPTISHHLRILRNAGLIRSRQDGTWVRHSNNPAAAAPLRDLLGTFSETLEPA